MISGSAQVLQVQNLAISYETRHGDVPAVRDVSFGIRRGETLGIVGESGCGKSTVAYGIVGFLGNGHIVDGSIKFCGEELRGRSEKELHRLRGGQIAMVHQDPMQSLNPSMRVGDQLSEVLVVHRGMTNRDACARCIKMLDRVYIPSPEAMMERYPHQLSGGQQQRVVIAMALLADPVLLIMDEPTTALDVTVEATVLDLISELREELDTAILYISHNLGVIARISDRVGVMYAGEMVESAPVEEIFLQSAHPYTQGLLRCVPTLESSKQARYLTPIAGSVPSPGDLPEGCVYAPRCGFVQPKCWQEHPQLVKRLDNHRVRCFFAGEVAMTDWRELGEIPAAALVRSGVQQLGAEPVLKTQNVSTYYPHTSGSLLNLIGLGEKQWLRAVDGVDLLIPKGVTFGVVGESGCGKTTLAKTIIGLESLTGGEIEFMGVDISMPVRSRDKELIKGLRMVFQNPDSTLNPSFTIGYQIGRQIRRFQTVPRGQVHQEVLRLLDQVKLDARYVSRLPRQLSGGEKQRVGIARALASRPELVLCDEPVSSLDVSVQAAVLNLLTEIQRKYGTTLLFIAHDLSVVRYFSDFVAVMYLGQIVEVGMAHDIYEPPYHPYTEALLSAVPIPNPSIQQKHIRLEGTVPSAFNPPSGCRFHTRCPRKIGEICETQVPPMRNLGDGHLIACHIPLEKLREIKPVIFTS